MRMFFNSVICGTFTLLTWSAGVLGQEVVKGEFASPKTDEEMIANALSAAPELIAKNATVIAFDANRKVRTLRKGSNNFTCIPDDPTNPANDPDCVDANGLEWVMAWVNKTDPPKGARWVSATCCKAARRQAMWTRSRPSRRAESG
jgi:hypothetical protein